MSAKRIYSRALIETWGKVPLEFIQHLDLRHRLYGFVGFGDYTLYPLLRPGSFVEIDPELRIVGQRSPRSELTARSILSIFERIRVLVVRINGR